MKKIFHITFVFILINSLSLKAQEFYVSGGMGINYAQMEKLNEYLHYNWGFQNRRDDQHAAVEFYALAGTILNPNVSFETSFGYTLNSFSKNYGFGFYELSYAFYLPEVNLNYLLAYTHYGFSFGFGIGYYLGSVEEKNPGVSFRYIEETKGIAFQIKSTAYTQLSEDLFVELTANYRQSFLSDLSPSFIINKETSEVLNLSFNSLGLKIGMRYQF